MTRRAILAVLAVGLGAALPARAGVYVPAERPTLPPANQVKLPLGLLRAARVAPGAPPAKPGTPRWFYEHLAAALEAQEKAGELSTLDRVNLGGCYVRMGRYQDAIRVLEAGDRKHFLVLANLASAYHAIDQLDRAVSYQRQALDAWPPVWAGWTFWQMQGYRRVERYYLTLLQLRHREQVHAGGRPAPITAVDELFPKVRFVGPDGRYGPGALAQEMIDELPPDATDVVLQLVFWLPYDDRVYWLLGELLNASGHVEAAYDVLDELVYARRVSVPALAQHRQALRKAQEAIKELRKPATRNLLLAAAAPRTALVPPVAGSLGQATAAWVPVLLPPAAGPADAPNAPVGSAPPPPNWLPDWRALGVGFGAGMVVAVVAALQWREWRRKRPAAATAPAHAAGNGHAGPAEAPQGERGASAP
jgi:tetratricopeptide (TPR) repeat protein